MVSLRLACEMSVLLLLAILLVSCQSFGFADKSIPITISASNRPSEHQQVLNRNRHRLHSSKTEDSEPRFKLRPHRFSRRATDDVVADDSSTSSSGSDIIAKEVQVTFDPNAAVETDLPFFGKVTLSKSFWKAVMFGICIVWSTNFAVIKNVFASLPDNVLDPSLYVAIRFTIAAIIMAPGAIGSFNNIGLLKNGVWVSLCVFTGYIGQAIGIMSSTANKCAFFCSLNSIWVALVSGLLTGVYPRRTWIAIALAIVGAAFIELGGFVQPELSDLWLILQPIGFGTGYIVVQENMKKYPDSANAITAFKLIFLSILTCSWAAYEGHTLSDVIPILESPVAVAGILYASVVTTALAIWVQSIAFKNVDATTASIILTSEPIWAAGFATVLIGEVITTQDIVGGALIILGCLYNEIDLVDMFQKWRSGNIGEEASSGNSNSNSSRPALERGD